MSQKAPKSWEVLIADRCKRMADLRLELDAVPSSNHQNWDGDH